MIPQLRDLEAKATPAPWGWENHGEKCNCAVLGTFYNVKTMEPIPGHVTSEVYNEAVGDYERRADIDELIASKDDNARYADFALIAATRNALPLLLAALEAAWAELDHVRDECEVKRTGSYGYHSPQDDIEIAKWRELIAKTDQTRRALERQDG